VHHIQHLICIDDDYMQAQCTLLRLPAGLSVHYADNLQQTRAHSAAITSRRLRLNAQQLRAGIAAANCSMLESHLHSALPCADA
jgi:hypothetical protein